MVTCWERVDLLALVCDVYLCFVTFPCDILGQVCYLIVSIPDLCQLSDFVNVYVSKYVFMSMPLCMFVVSIMYMCDSL